MPELSNERLAEMLAGLEGVTPGPWDTVAGIVRSIDGDEAIPIFDSRDPWKKHRRTSTVQRQAWHNLHHVARCDPDTIRAIIAELQQRRAAADDTHRCFICQQPFHAGQMVLTDVNEGLGHRECFGEDREAYVKDTDTGEPLGPDDPIPAGEPYDPADYAEPVRRADVVRPLEWHGPDGDDEYYAKTIIGTFTIGHERSDGTRWAMGGYHPSIDTAKAAIQSDYAARIRTALAPATPTHRHKKRGSEYVLIGIGKMQAEHWRDPNLDADYDNQAVDMREVAIYRDVKDGSLWARPREEFEDGRFEAISRTEGQ